jgi:hypothetical protein
MVVDFIGREIKVDDYVTAPWDRGNIELFRVIEIREQGPRLGANKTRRTIQRTDQLVLERTWKEQNCKADVANKKVYRKPDQCTLVDTAYVMIYMLAR